MKKIITLLAAVVLVFAVTKVKAADKVITFGELPENAQAFIKKHFDVKDVILVKMDTEYLIRKEYEVKFSNGSEVEFNGDGEWKKVDMKRGVVPAALVPASIAQHVNKSFPNTSITEIKKSRNKIEVEISNGLELEFTKDGEFIRIDD